MKEMADITVMLYDSPSSTKPIRWRKTNFLTLPRELRQKIIRHTQDFNLLAPTRDIHNFHGTLYTNEMKIRNWTLRFRKAHQLVVQDIAYLAGRLIKKEIESWLPTAMERLQEQSSERKCYRRLRFCGRVYELEACIHQLETVVLRGLEDGRSWFELRKEVLRAGALRSSL